MRNAIRALPAGILLGLVLASLPGCNASGPATSSATGDSQASGAAEGRLTVGVIPKCTGGEFWETVEVGAKSAGKDLGVDIKWEGALAETEIAEQNKIIENMINLEVDGMAIAPLNPKATSKSVKAGVEAGIPVVIFDSSVDGNSHFSFVATDNEAGGSLGGEHILEKLGDDKGKVILLRYVQGTASTEARAKGFIETVTSAGVEIATDAYPEDGSVAGSKKTAANVLEAYVNGNKLEIDGVFTCNLSSTLGMSAALDDLRKAGVEVEVAFVGFDTSPKLIQAVQSGHIDALVSQNPKRMGYLAVESLVKHLRGESVSPRIDTGLELVTAERLKSDSDLRTLVGLE